MNETRRKPTTGTQCLLSSISGAGSLICPVAETRLDIPRPWTTGGGGGVKVLWHEADSTADLHDDLASQPADHDDHPKSEDQLYPGSSTGVGSLQ